MKTYCFTVDDNVRFLKDLTEKEYKSIFEHPYLAMYQSLHEIFDLKVQLNLFYRMEGFDLSQMTDAYYEEFKRNSEWLKLSFHSELENARPYEFSGYDEVFGDCKRVNNEIKRFVSESALAKTTTVHYCRTTEEGLKALSDNQVMGLLGLFGDAKNPRTSYGIGEEIASRIRNGEIVKLGQIDFASIDIILNKFPKEEILIRLEGLEERECIRVMIHEQYFYSDYKSYQPNFENKLTATFSFLKEHGYESKFFEEVAGVR
ncbi:MAG: hypothetical protein E7580_07435 [Ruminococcaceae bacterium]|nr:hypothetical protein [Oscillospiraceae bacterium]